MTAEIAVMNRSAVALAADSAVTIQSDGKLKIYNTHKIFTLSKYQPVGIMVYGNASLTGVPWEPVIKTYRGQLASKKLGTVKEYAEDFVRFLDSKNQLFPESEQKTRFGLWAAYYLHARLRTRIDEHVKAIDETGTKITEKQLRDIVRVLIGTVYQQFVALAPLPHLPADFIHSLIKAYRDIIDQAIGRVFQNVPLTKTLLTKLRFICAGLFAKQHWINPDQSGVVIAGFGVDEIFPSLTTVLLGGVAHGRLKYEIQDHESISVDNSATVLAFAQKEMVESFMEGIDPNFQTTIASYLSVLFEQYPDVLANSIKELTGAKKKAYSKKWKQVGKGVVGEILKESGKLQTQEPRRPGDKHSRCASQR